MESGFIFGNFILRPGESRLDGQRALLLQQPSLHIPSGLRSCVPADLRGFSVARGRLGCGEQSTCLLVCHVRGSRDIEQIG